MPLGMLRIGVLSDTHVPDRQRQVPEAILRGLEGVDMIIHAGDLTSVQVLDILQKIAPVYAVCGNMDSDQVKSILEPSRVVNVLGKKIAVMHGVQPHSLTEEAARTRFPDADCVVFGHTHRPHCEYDGKRLIFNPGSACGAPWAGASYGFLYVVEGSDPIRGEIIEV